DRCDSRMRIRRAHETALQRVFADIVGEAAMTAEQTVILDALHGGAEPTRGHSAPSPPFPTSGEDSAAARSTERRIDAYPVQRHRLPAIPSSISCAEGLGCCASRPTTDITNPGVQNPHCRPWHSWNACCTGCSGAWSRARPSMVVTS